MRYASAKRCETSSEHGPWSPDACGRTILIWFYINCHTIDANASIMFFQRIFFAESFGDARMIMMGRISIEIIAHCLTVRHFHFFFFICTPSFGSSIHHKSMGNFWCVADTALHSIRPEWKLFTIYYFNGAHRTLCDNFCRMFRKLAIRIDRQYRVPTLTSAHRVSHVLLSAICAVTVVRVVRFSCDSEWIGSEEKLSSHIQYSTLLCMYFLSIANVLR